MSSNEVRIDEPAPEAVLEGDSPAEVMALDDAREPTTSRTAREVGELLAEGLRDAAEE